MNIAQETRYSSPEEYPELEVNSDIRHEYIDGFIIPMTGGTPNHNQITGNIYVAIHIALKRLPYQGFITDQRLWIPNRRIHTYPKIIMVVQTPLVFEEGRIDTVTNPVMIAEILSNSTKSYDKDEKFAAYRTIPTFQEYILIDQYRMYVEQYCKIGDNKWVFYEFTDAETTLNLASVPCQIVLADIYDKVNFNVEE